MIIIIKNKKKCLRPQSEAGIWSCDLRANEMPKKITAPMAQTDKQTNRQTDGHGDSKTNLAEVVKI